MKLQHADAQYESITIPSSTVTFSSNHVNDSLNDLDESVESIYYKFIVERLKIYLSSVEKMIVPSNLSKHQI